MEVPVVTALYTKLSPDADPEPVVTLFLDGSIEYGPNYTPTEAASVFWHAIGLREHMKDAFDTIQEYVLKLEESLREMREHYILADAEREALRNEVGSLRPR